MPGHPYPKQHLHQKRALSGEKKKRKLGQEMFSYQPFGLRLLLETN